MNTYTAAIKLVINNTFVSLINFALRIVNTVVQTWQWLVGAEKEFTLVTRIFHSICLICVFALIYNIPLNFFVGLPTIAFISAGSLFLITAIYLISRYKSKTDLAVLAFCFVGLSLFVVNFFLNSGIDGPTDLFFLLMMVIMVAIVPVRRYWIAVTFNILLVIGLHYIQYTHKELVPFTYKIPLDQYIDISSAYVTVVAVLLFTFYVIRKNYELEKRSADEKTTAMVVLNEEKNKLLSILSHDLRAPLSNIQNYLELLTEIEITEQERLEIKKQLLQSTRGTLDLLNNVLSWSKNQMEGIKFSLSSLNVNDLLSRHLLVFIPIAQSKKIRLDIWIEPEVNTIADGDMLQLVVRNLINNAIKFTSPGGTITVTASNRAGKCLIVVKDSGNGKPAELSENIFNLNTGAEKGTMGEKGAGLGLVLCKQFTAVQNGRIWFQCDTYSGTSFFVELPLPVQEDQYASQ